MNRAVIASAAAALIAAAGVGSSSPARSDCRRALSP